MAELLTFDHLRSLSGNADRIDVPCPLCMGQTKTLAGRKRKCLSIWDDGGDFITFNCKRCGEQGWVKPDTSHGYTPQPKVDKQPVQKEDRGPLCNYLWDKSRPAIGSPVQTYLEARQCWAGRAPAASRYLPGRAGEPHAMISRFGLPDDPITGVHLTKLSPDGSGKAGTDVDKRTIGDTMGQPIVVYSNEDRGECVIAEGIEDTESMVIATGWTGWAAGTAGRIPAVVAAAVKQGFDKIYVAQDVDHLNMTTRKPGASAAAIEQARGFAPIIPVSFGGRVSGMADHMDANAFLIRYGKDSVAAAIEWCFLQDQHDRGLLTFHQMKRMREPLTHILFPDT